MCYLTIYGNISIYGIMYIVELFKVSQNCLKLGDERIWALFRCLPPHLAKHLGYCNLLCSFYALTQMCLKLGMSDFGVYFVVYPNPLSLSQTICVYCNLYLYFNSDTVPK